MRSATAPGPSLASPRPKVRRSLRGVPSPPPVRAETDRSGEDELRRPRPNGALALAGLAAAARAQLVK